MIINKSNSKIKSTYLLVCYVLNNKKLSKEEFQIAITNIVKNVLKNILNKNMKKMKLIYVLHVENLSMNYLLKICYHKKGKMHLKLMFWMPYKRIECQKQPQNYVMGIKNKLSKLLTKVTFQNQGLSPSLYLVKEMHQ